jgi:hypothetical protein
MTRQKIVHEVPFLAFTSNDNHRYAVSLPAPPWGRLDRDDRSATAPRTAPVRYSGPLDPLKYDPILRHAGTRKDNG